jgi:hypothetical protein
MLDRRLGTRAVQGARLARMPGAAIPLARRVINPLLIGAPINTPRITRQEAAQESERAGKRAANNHHLLVMCHD